jgi:deoxyhypusine monooxygenase
MRQGLGILPFARGLAMVSGVAAHRDCLIDVGQSLGKRTNAAFFLRTDGSPEAVEAISEALRNRDDSALLRHELAYILGQIQDARACAVLSDILQDGNDDCMVRHEAAEALGAIGEPAVLPLLEKFAEDPVKEVADTCRLAIDLINWRQHG